MILLVLVIFLFNRQTINNVFEKTGFLNVISRELQIDRKPELLRKTPAKEDKEREDRSTSSPEENPEIVLNIENSLPPEKEPEKIPEEKNMRKASLYFIEVKQNGDINLKPVKRSIYYVDSPLTETIKALLNGPSPSELNMELITLIPEKTELRSVYVKDHIAYIDFNESFRFNSLGVEGYIAQLKQIVYTATEYSTVKKVQFLIEGKRHKYLGAEGVNIEKPLDRESF